MMNDFFRPGMAPKASTEVCQEGRLQTRELSDLELEQVAAGKNRGGGGGGGGAATGGSSASCPYCEA